MPRTMRVVAVTPTWNEADNLPALVRGLRRAWPGVRVLVVDDASPDGTAECARALDQSGDVQVLERPRKLGLASAYVAGFQQALAWGADRVVQLDADLSHDPADLPRLVRVDAGLVLGSRYVPGGGVRRWPLRRRVLSRFGSWYASAWLGGAVRDWTGGFKCWEAGLLAQVLTRQVRAEGYAFQVELTLRALRAGARVVEVPITFTERREGRSKMSPRIAVEAAWVVPALRLAQEER